MTIEERAEEFSIEKAGIPNGLGAKHFEDLYVQIAKEQQRIDIEKACKATCDWCQHTNGRCFEKDSDSCIRLLAIKQVMEG